MAQIKFYIIFYFLFSFHTNAQLGKEAWHWQFGNGVSLDFSSGSPIVGTSAINTDEGCASISDTATGQLLFYTDGTLVWDRNNNQMPNGFGLLGNSSTTQSALIVPTPGNANLYYVVTCDANGGTIGTHFSVIDMNLNGGLGDVSIKNTLLTNPPTTEKLTAVKHFNDIDYWIINHQFNSNTFNVYLVTSAGINLTPITSNVGTIETGSPVAAVGYLKASPNGKKLALAVEASVPILEIYDFDNSTGQITDPITISYSGYWNGPYGVTFSPDNSKLYAADPDTGYLYQYDISNDTLSVIMASKKVIASGFSGATLQNGPDGKIYIANDGTTVLSIINNPNNDGVACNYQVSGLNLTAGTCSYGLPNFIDANNYSNNVGIKQITANNIQISVYPNPANATLKITCSLQFATYSLQDILGNVIKTKEIKNKGETIDVSSLNDGIYFVNVKTTAGVVTKKIIVQH